MANQSEMGLEALPFWSLRVPFQLLSGTALQLLTHFQETATCSAAVCSGRGAWPPCVCAVFMREKRVNMLQSFLGNCQHLGETRSLFIFFLLFFFLCVIYCLSLLPTPPFLSPVSSELCLLRTSCLNTPPAAAALIVTATRSSPAVRSTGATLFARGGLPWCSKDNSVYLEKQTVKSVFYRTAQACWFQRNEVNPHETSFYSPNRVYFQEFRSEVQFWTLPV